MAKTNSVKGGQGTPKIPLKRRSAKNRYFWSKNSNLSPFLQWQIFLVIFCEGRGGGDDLNFAKILLAKLFSVEGLRGMGVVPVVLSFFSLKS